MLVYKPCGILGTTIANKYKEQLNKKKALINTSFNAHEQPIIISPDLALKCLIENRVDVLVLSDYIVKVK